MFKIILGIAICIGSSYIGWKLGKKVVKWLTKKQNKRIWDIKRENLLGVPVEIKINNKYTDIKKVSQVSFERFLKLYEVSSEHWLITKEDIRGYNDYFPVYVKYDTQIPLFWETGEDLQKYREWVKEKFAKGEAALYQQARDESMKLLTKFIKEDLEAKRKRTEEEMAELEAQVKKECERAKEKQKEIQLTLEPQTSALAWSDTPEEVTGEIRKLEIDSSGDVITEPSSTYIQPNQLDYNYICQIRDGFTQQLQMANMQAAQDYWLSRCQSSIMQQAQAQVQYNNIMQSIHPFHF